MGSHQGDPTVLGMINANLENISFDLNEIKKELKNGAVRMENHNVRLKNIECDVRDLTNGQKKIKKELYNHVNNREDHYNQGYKETIPQRMWRKKVEITIITSVLGILTILVNHFFG